MSKEANIWNRVNSAWRELVDSTTIALNLSPGQASFSVKPEAFAHLEPASIVWVIDGGGLTVTTGVKGDIEVPFACTITSATLLADQTGDIVIDIWKDTFANAPPDNSDSITASAPPTISNGVKSTDSTLSGWTTTLSTGDILRFSVDSVVDIQRVVLTLRVTRTQ